MAAAPSTEVSRAEWEKQVTEDIQGRMFERVNDLSNIDETYAVDRPHRRAGVRGEAIPVMAR